MDSWHSIAALNRGLNWTLGGAAVFGFFAGLLSTVAFVMQLRRDVLGQDRHVPADAQAMLAGELRAALGSDRDLNVGIYVAAGSRDRDVGSFAGEIQGACAQAGLSSGGGGIPDTGVPLAGLVVAVDRTMLPRLDLVGLLRKAGLRAKEVPHESFKRRNYTGAFLIIVTDKP